MAGAGVLAGPGQALVVDKKHLAVRLADHSDAGVAAGDKGQILSEDAFRGEVFQNAAGAVVFVADDGSLPVQQDAYGLAGCVEGVDFLAGVEAALLGLHALQHTAAVMGAYALKKESFGVIHGIYASFPAFFFSMAQKGCKSNRIYGKLLL